MKNIFLLKLKSFFKLLFVCSKLLVCKLRNRNPKLTKTFKWSQLTLNLIGKWFLHIFSEYSVLRINLRSDFNKKWRIFNKIMKFWSVKYTMLVTMSRKFVHIFMNASTNILYCFIHVTHLLLDIYEGKMHLTPGRKSWSWIF